MYGQELDWWEGWDFDSCVMRWVVVRVGPYFGGMVVANADLCIGRVGIN